MSDQMLLEPAESHDPNPDGLSFLPIDPFQARPHVASRIAPLGGPDAGEDPTYAFQSVQVFPPPGAVRFTLTFHDLLATTGTLSIRVHALSTFPGTAPMLLKTVTLDLAGIAVGDGMVEVAFESRRNMMYTLSGTIEDETDAVAHALSLTLTPRERDAPLPNADPVNPSAAPRVARIAHHRERPELVTMQKPVLARPVSQAMTAPQIRDPLVAAWNGVLGQPDGSGAEAWENAFILQALAYYDVPTKDAAALGMFPAYHPLPSYLAGRGCTVLTAATQRDDWPEGDPGRALEQLHDRSLCNPRQFFDSVHLTLFEHLAVPPGLGGFDFLWSTGTSRDATTRARFPQMLRDSIACLKLGGVAIHMLRYSGEIGTLSYLDTVDPDAAPNDPPWTSFARAEIERMALSLIADGHEVAQLKFDVDPRQGIGARNIPFALIARRMR
ncbi:hypothetical protein [Sphingomonas sp. PAMC 26621]|uniref:hypothetical protein n=1 Tax=Sphingomonas sp. PAMC 26621 TaxID=1112213 RepID=UPI000287F513|nr:hypothetical protein [Sphingomonas sp. PAMC 26621]